MDEVLNVITFDNIAFWLSGGSLLVALGSLVVALMAKQQARQAALLMSRAEAIANLRHALGDLNRDGLASTKTMDRIQNALNLSHLVFSKAVRKNVEQAYISARLVQQGEDMENGIVTLKEDLSKLIAQMNEEAALVRVPQERPHAAGAGSAGNKKPRLPGGRSGAKVGKHSGHHDDPVLRP